MMRARYHYIMAWAFLLIALVFTLPALPMQLVWTILRAISNFFQRIANENKALSDELYKRFDKGAEDGI